jgi:hypothetical protein
MTSRAQKEANTRYRAKLADRGLVRVEVIVPEKDRDVVRAFADSLVAGLETAEDGATLSGADIWDALGSAPSSLSELKIDRSQYDTRAIDL